MPEPGPISKHTPLRTWERLGLVVLVILFVAFGALVEFRTAFLSRRMGDADVFFRAAWAVRSGADLYTVTDNNGFHYNYPPLLAILMVPLAIGPDGASTDGMLPFPIVVAVWYFLNLVFLGCALHWLASAFEERVPGLNWRRWSRGWWALRMVPMLACLVPIGHTLMRGQSNLLVLACFAATLACTLRQRRFQSGLWLAGAMCLKIFPAFMGLFFLWRRDFRAIAGCALGLILGLVVIPGVVMGPSRTALCYQRLTRVLILPGLGVGGDDSRAHELTTVNGSIDNQSLLAITHRSFYPDAGARPVESRLMRVTVGLIGILLTLVPLLAHGRSNQDPIATVLLFGCLVLNMLFVSPVCHLHYFSLAVPLVMALLVKHWQDKQVLALGAGLVALFVANTIGNTLPNLPFLERARDHGLATAAGLMLWLTGVAILRKRKSVRSVVAPAMMPVARAA